MPNLIKTTLGLPTNIRLEWKSLLGTLIITKIRKLQTKKLYNIGPWFQCYKTFYVRNLRVFVIS